MRATQAHKENPVSTQSMSLPPKVAALAPRREDFHSEEAYLEARDSFHHRVKHLARRPLRASPEK